MLIKIKSDPLALDLPSAYTGKVDRPSFTAGLFDYQ
jgi:hypothetical protein